MKSNILVLKISVVESIPLIYRTVEIPNDYTLLELHHLIQCLFLWSDTKKFVFKSGDEIIDPGFIKSITVSDIFNQTKPNFAYEYDPIGSWNIQIENLDSKYSQDLSKYPLCTNGAYAAPIEGSGAIIGFQQLCNAYQNPEDENYTYAIEILGDDFDPTYFDLEETNFYIRDEGELSSDFYSEFDEFNENGEFDDE